MAQSEAPIPIEYIDGDMGEAIKLILRQQPDLIIEGGTNNRPSLWNSFKTYSPISYIGMDINDWIDYGSSRFTVRGNCLNTIRVDEIKKDRGSARTALFTNNALNAILDRKMTHEERKSDYDFYSIDNAVANITALYVVQMHVDYGGFFEYQLSFYKKCFDMGWQITAIGQEHEYVVLTRD